METTKILDLLQAWRVSQIYLVKTVDLKDDMAIELVYVLRCILSICDDYSRVWKNRVCFLYSHYLMLS